MARRDDGTKDPYEVSDVEVKISTAKAFLIEKDGEEMWIPKSQLLEGTDVEDKGDTGKIVLPMWLAKEKGLT